MMSPRLEIDADPHSVQRIAAPSNSERFEGLGFSSSGDILGVATADTNSVFLFRRKADGRFEDTPYSKIGGPDSGLHYPHDIAISLCGETELLAVAQRRGAIALFEKNKANETFCSEPVVEISGRKSKLAFSDGVAFVPPNNDYLAACNLKLGTISFFRRTSMSPIRFEAKPEFQLKHRSLSHPDGLGFSQCGRWLAVANHGNHSVSIFERGQRYFSGRLKYGPKPVTTTQDPILRYPHSVAFTPQTNHLVVTNAGANFFCVYAPKPDHLGMRWSTTSTLQKIVGAEDTFREVNARNKMEGGPKGIAIHANNIAVCSPEFGVEIYSFRE